MPSKSPVCNNVNERSTITTPWFGVPVKLRVLLKSDSFKDTVICRGYITSAIDACVRMKYLWNYSEINLSHGQFSIKNPTWTELGLSPGLRYEGPEANTLSKGMVQAECWNIPSAVHHRHHHHHRCHHVTGNVNPSHCNFIPKNLHSYFSRNQPGKG
jgi:hypothetical protein